MQKKSMVHLATGFAATIATGFEFLDIAQDYQRRAVIDPSICVIVTASGRSAP